MDMVDDLVRLASHHPEISRGLDLYTNVELIGNPPAFAGISVIVASISELCMDV